MLFFVFFYFLIELGTSMDRLHSICLTLYLLVTCIIVGVKIDSTRSSWTHFCEEPYTECFYLPFC